MKIELKNNRSTTVIADLDLGDTFLRRSTINDNDSVFMTIEADFCYKAVDLGSGEVIALDEDTVVIPIKVKVVEDR